MGQTHNAPLKWDVVGDDIIFLFRGEKLLWDSLKQLRHIVPRRQPPQKQMKAMIATSEIIPPKPPPTAAAIVRFGPVE